MTVILVGLIISACVAHPLNANAEGRGRYVFGHEVNTFAPCGSNDVLWVNGTDAVANSLAREYADLATEPYKAVYVELLGHRSPRAQDGFAADYDGLFVVKEVLTVRQLQPGDCD